VEHLIQEALSAAMEGRTSLVIAHRLSTVVRADRILVLVDGRIVEEGSHEALLRRDGLTRSSSALQFGGGMGRFLESFLAFARENVPVVYGILLAPLGGVASMGTWCRNFCYDHGLFAQWVDAPTR
jgi:hypothetical protein